MPRAIVYIACCSMPWFRANEQGCSVISGTKCPGISENNDEKVKHLILRHQLFSPSVDLCIMINIKYMATKSLYSNDLK